MEQRDELLERMLNDPDTRRRMAEIDQEIEQRASFKRAVGADTLGDIEAKRSLADSEPGST